MQCSCVMTSSHVAGWVADVVVAATAVVATGVVGYGCDDIVVAAGVVGSGWGVVVSTFVVSGAVVAVTSL